MYCANCGTRASENATYCHQCGSFLSISPSPGATVLVEADEADRRPKSGMVPWGGGQVALGISLILVTLIPVTAIAFGTQQLTERYQDAVATWVSVHVMALAIVVVVWRLGVHRLRSPLSLLGLAPLAFPQAKTVLLAAGALGASLGFTVVYGAVVGLFDSEVLTPPEITSDIAFPGAGVVLTFQALALVTPLTEEVFFRGFVFSGLIHRLGVGWATVGSAVVFSLFHVTPGVLIPVFVTGLLLAWLYHRTGSLWPSILAHAGQNALAVAIEVYAG